MTEIRSDPAELRAVAEQLASEAAAFVRRRRKEVFGADGRRGGASDAVHAKSTPTDPVTVVDTETERLLRDRLAQVRPGEPVLGEEGGGRAGERGGSITWVLDPVDGTVNFVYGLPAYAVSVAAQQSGASLAGAVADVVGERLYSAGIGLGAHVVGAAGERWPLRCNDIDDLSMALLGTGFGYSPDRRRQQAALLAELLPVVRDVRRIGSAALDLCFVAEGKLDAHYEHGLNAWDWAAGALIAAEAGAWVRLPPARATMDSPGLVLAAAPGIASELLEVLERLGAADTLPDRRVE
ncbi:inositol monophosphatase family protein [Mycobacterium sp.]|uniref:inositol monophosphatase family protein n=1 Tax=Mycobacterium sp. TaxID=1785 RepID=UPI002D3CEE62|nr:inositol monophosphatase family protein [Mycobacterium sp.]HZA10404.1 inositol monophosphatase family protein [Mycobacterium sp.]